jgi:outer membrane protein OmpA-like peptidoglycan-associated protein
MTPITTSTRRAVLLLSCALAAGCATDAQRAAVKGQLERATAAYERARTDPYARTYAPFPLHDAESALLAANDTRSLARQHHYGYVAEKRAQTALAVAEGRRAEQGLALLGKETAEVIAQARDRDAQAARAEAEARGQELGRTRQEMEAMSRQGEDARRRLELQALEMERAKGAVELKSREMDLTAKELAELKAHHNERGLALTPPDVLFPTGTADIAPGGSRSLEKLAMLLQKNPKLLVLIEGHTDSAGGDKLNAALSEKRAQAVKQLLIGKGVNPDRITTKGYGKQYPVAPNDSSSGRQQNRRVEVVILDDAAQVPSASPR